MIRLLGQLFGTLTDLRQLVSVSSQNATTLRGDGIVTLSTSGHDRCWVPYFCQRGQPPSDRHGERAGVSCV